MIDLYTWSTPNGYKVSIALEEMGLDYQVHPIDIMKDEQFQQHFLDISPNNRIPAIVDRDTNQPVFESGAILLYLADKTGSFLAKEGPRHWQAMEWLMWQMGGFGPMLGQAHHFLQFNPGKAPYAEERYGNEAKRLWGVLDKRLAQEEYVAGDYSISDMAIWPWAARFEWQRIDVNEFANVKRWYKAIAGRPAVKAGFKVPNPDREIPQVD